MRMREKTFVLSMDALVGEDVSYLWCKPNFSRIFRQCAKVNQVSTIYPSITYPAHASIITGCRPGKHGVVTNGAFKTTAGPTQWHLYSDMIKVEDIFAIAKCCGCSTAAIYWPITGNNPNIDYLINEYFFPDEQETIESGFAKLGANEETMQVIRENRNRLPSHYRNREGKLQLKHTFDDFINGCACSMIQKYQPDLLLVHNCLIDTWRHKYGIFNDNITEGLDQMDIWLGEIIDAMTEAGVYDKTNFVLLSDHGQLNYVRGVKINLLLARRGFIKIANNGTVEDWEAFAQTNGMSATIFLRDAKNQESYRKVYEYLLELSSQGVWGISKVYTEAECAEKYGLYGEFSFVVESDGYTGFSDQWTEPLVNPVDLTDYHFCAATHGYEPEKGPQPIFLGAGPAFQPGAVIDKAQIIDEAPTLARILGGTMEQAEGRCMHEILRPGR